MKVQYRGCELEAHRDGDLIYSIFTDDGYEVTSGYSEGSDTVREWIKYLKNITDDFYDNYDRDENKWEERYDDRY